MDGVGGLVVVALDDEPVGVAADDAVQDHQVAVQAAVVFDYLAFVVAGGADHHDQVAGVVARLHADTVGHHVADPPSGDSRPGHGEEPNQDDAHQAP